MADASRPTTIGRYRLLDLLGRGAVTETHRAKSFGVEGFEKTLVVKRLLPEAAGGAALVGAVLAATERAMRLSHANVAQVFDAGREATPAGETLYFATEHVNGLDLSTLLARLAHAGRQTPLPVAVAIALEVGKALDHAHRRRDESLRVSPVVHGAVTPHSVLVSFDGDVKVTDFGLGCAALAALGADRTPARVVAGASPEVAAGGEPTPRSDVFSLASLLHGLVAGSPPFLRESGAATARELGRAAPPRLDALRADVPRGIADAVARALSTDPAARPSSVAELHDQLHACAYGAGLRAGPEDIARLVDELREPEPELFTVDIDELLSRPLSLAPPDETPSPGGAAEDTDAELEDRRSATGPAASELGERRHASALVLELPPGVGGAAIEARVRGVVERYGGVLAGPVGARAVAWFGLDRADGRDVELAARCGLVLVRSLRGSAGAPGVGIDAGRVRCSPEGSVVLDERARFVVDAARELAAESPGAAVVTPRVAQGLVRRFPLEPSGGGFRVTEFAQDRFLDAFVGRREVLSRVGERLVRAARAKLQTVVVTGPPGIGKTRLAVEVQRRLARGTITIGTTFATCPPRGRGIPGSGLVVMLRRVAGVHDGDPREAIDALMPRLRALGMDAEEVAAVVSALGGSEARGPSASRALASAFLRMLHSLAEDRFSAFVWDDAQELDDVTADVLARASTRIATSRVALLLVGRAEEGARFLSLPADERLELGPLDPAEVRDLIAARAEIEQVPPALFEFVRDRAEGSPLFVEELVRQVLDGGLARVEDGAVTALALEGAVGLSRSLRAVTLERLRSLGARDRAAFAAASILEPPASPAVIAEVAGLGRDETLRALESLASHGLIAAEGSAGFAVASPLWAEVALAELERDEFAALHLRAAAALERAERAGSPTRAGRVGHHLAAAGERSRAADAYARGGLASLAEGRLDRAATELCAALTVADLDGRPVAELAGWLSGLREAVRHLASHPGLPALVARLAERLEADRGSFALRARLDLAALLGALGDELGGEALLDRAAAEVRGDAEATAKLLTTYAELAAGRGDFRAARRALDPLAQMAVSDPGDLHRGTLAAARTLAAAGKDAAARSALAEATRAARPGDGVASYERAATRTFLELAAGRFRDAADSALVAAAQAEELALTREVAASLADHALAAAFSGDAARAAASAGSAARAAEESGAARVALRCRALDAYLEALSTRRADDAELRAIVAAAESRGWITEALIGRSLLGRALAASGDAAGARSEFELAVRIATSTGNTATAEADRAAARSVR